MLLYNSDPTVDLLSLKKDEEINIDAELKANGSEYMKN